MTPAVFLDRDGCVIKHVHHLVNPADVELIPGSADAIKHLQEAGFLCVIVTNQSVVGRGMLSLDGLKAVHDEMNAQLGREGAEIDALYFCTAVPRGKDQTVVEEQDRKPGPGMLLRAAREHGIHLGRSYMIGDSISDLHAGINAGCFESLLVLTGYGRSVMEKYGFSGRAFETLWDAAQAILEETRSQP
jgi:D-glycero-D-manno-heptose 1,7-bisphosphate phosphatase